MRAAIGQIPSKSGTGTVRGALQAGTRVTIMASNPRTAGVKIVTSGAKLPPNKRALVKAMNKESFRHPVFANPSHVRNWRTKAVRALAAFRGIAPKKVQSWKWVEQKGHPYFGAVLAERRSAIEADISAAAQRAADQIAQSMTQ